MSNIYWVGIRESDLLSVDGLYCGSVTFFGSGEKGNRRTRIRNVYGENEDS